MTLTRADFMKVLGVTLASVLLTRCNAILQTPQTSRQRLRSLWLRFRDLADKTLAGRNDEDQLGQQMIAEHRAALDELAATGVLSSPVADLVHESYSAAVYHVWRSNAPITCYEPMMVNYAPTGAAVLVKQSEILGELAAQGNVDPSTLAKARAALEHDMAFYDLTDDETQALYQRVMQQGQDGVLAIPSFDALDLELTPEARDAARFILDLLSEP